MIPIGKISRDALPFFQNTRDESTALPSASREPCTEVFSHSEMAEESRIQIPIVRISFPN